MTQQTSSAEPSGLFPAYESLLAPDTPDTGAGQQLGVEPLEAFLARTPELALAFSGGTDSAYLMVRAKRAGCAVRAYQVQSVFQPREELDDAERVAELLNIELKILELDILSQEQVRANTPLRCYECKKVIFRTIEQALRQEGACEGSSRSASDIPLVDGTNGTDDPLRRPGFQALKEQGVVSPLRRAGLSKAAIRAGLADEERALGLAPGSLLSQKPSFPCLAALVPTGTLLTEEILAAVKANS